MRIIIKYILINLKERKLRTLVMLFSTLLSTTLLFVSFSIGASYESAQRKMARGMAGSATTAVTAKERAIHIEEIPDLPSMNARVGILKGTALYHENGYYETVDIISADLNQLNRINPPRLADGGEITGFTGSQVILPDRFTSKYGIQKGDSITLQINGNPVSLTVAEIAAYDTVFLRHTRGATALLPYPAPAEALNWQEGFSEILIEPADGVTPEELLNELTAALSGGVYQVSNIVSEEQIANDASATPVWNGPDLRQAIPSPCLGAREEINTWWPVASNPGPPMLRR